MNSLRKLDAAKDLPRGVTFSGSTVSPYLAQVCIGGRRFYVGVYRTPEEASEAYLTARAAWTRLEDNLAWTHGSKAARQILRTYTQSEDLKAWKRLGQRKAAA